MKGRRVRIPGDFDLEGILENEDVPDARRACVVCHPHPQFGGDMHNNVVLALRDGIAATGFATLRFNLRGVGGSAGRYGGGEGEVEDVRACLRFLGREGYDRVVVAGYSFGAWVGLRAGTREDVEFLLGVAPPLGLFDFSFLHDSQIPVGIVAGDSDAFCPPEKLEALARTLKGRGECVRIPGGDHFLFGREDEVAEAVAGLARTLAGPGTTRGR